jgi:Tol biopolymer transport system component
MFIRSQNNRGQDLVIIDDVNRPQQTTRDLTDWAKDEVHPHWSPDGQKIAFYSNEKSGKDQVFDLWVINADGTSPKLLVKDVIRDEHKGPAWSQDSSKVFFVKQDYNRSNPIMWVDIKTKKSKILTSQTQLNSDLVAYHDDNGVTRLVYSSKGHKNSKDKNWKRIFVVSFKASDLR